MASLLLVTIIALFIPLNLASPITYPSQLTPRSSDDEAHPEWGCPFEGNSDLYGLGIRLGVYLQLFSTLLANAFLSRSIRNDAHNTNAIIMIALFAGMANATIRGDMNGAEIFVMCTLLVSFVWSEFGPRHISGIVLFGAAGTSWDGVNKKRLFREKKERKLKEQWTIKDFYHDVKDDLAVEPPEEKDEKRYFAAVLRSAFGTAVGIFCCWFWISGRHALLKNGISDPVCEPTIFLHTQIELRGNKPLLYLILSIIYALWEVTFMVWWVFVLLPETLYLIYDITSIIIISIFTFKPSKLHEIRPKFAKWYLGFARLDENKLKCFSIFKMRPKTQECVRRWKFFFTWWGLPVGYSVIIWSTLAIELTLAWNSVSGIYILGSTGQLIPFVVGILGLLRNLHLIAVKVSEGTGRRKRIREREVRVVFEEGRWFYGDGKEGLWLEAGRPRRRGSFDSEVTVVEREREVGSVRSARTWRSEGG